jgi:virginiamycin B lyase
MKHALALAVLFVCLGTGLDAASFSFAPLPTPNSKPTAIAVNPYASNAWFIESGANKIARISFDDRSIQEYTIPTPGSDPRGIAVRHMDEIWFTEYASSKVGRLTGGVFTEFPTPTPDSGPTGIVSDNTSLWFTETKANKIVKIAPDNSMIEYSIPTPMAGATEITAFVLNQTTIYFAESQAGQIGILTPDGRILEVPLPSADARPSNIVAGNDPLRPGLWFSEPGVNKIGRIDYLTSAITEYSIPTPGSGPAGMTIGADTFVYFAETGASKIGVLANDGSILEYAIPAFSGDPVGIGATRNGYWFTDPASNSIGLIAPDRLFVVGAGYPPGWHTQFDLANPAGYGVEISIGVGPYPPTVCPGPCPGQAYALLPGRGTARIDRSDFSLAPTQIAPMFLQPLVGLDLPPTRVRVVNIGNPAQAIEIPSIRVATLQALDPAMLSFPGATRTSSAHSNLFLGVTTERPQDLTATAVHIEAFSPAGDLLATLERTFQPYPYLDLFDILAQLGIGELENAQIRVTRTTGNGTLWGILTTLGTDGSVAVSTGLNP